MKVSIQKIKNNLAFISAILITLISFNPVLAFEKLKIVPNDKVCMVTNMVFPRTQIPVIHKGKTYYGCCENCKKTLSEDAAAREAIDPVSGKSIDKAKAVIAARDDGSVIYFESKKTFKNFIKTLNK